MLPGGPQGLRQGQGGKGRQACDGCAAGTPRLWPPCPLLPLALEALLPLAGPSGKSREAELRVPWPLLCGHCCQTTNRASSRQRAAPHVVADARCPPHPTLQACPLLSPAPSLHRTHRCPHPPACPVSQEPNPSAVSRLLRQTEATKSRFLDRKFLRRQQKAGGAAARASRLWYVDLDTWMASTVGAVPGGGGASGAVGAGRVAQQVAAAPPEKHSVPVDDAQVGLQCGCRVRGALGWAQQRSGALSSMYSGALPWLRCLPCPADALRAVGRAV